MGFEVRLNNNPISIYSYTRVHDLCEGVGKLKVEVDSSLSINIGDTLTLYENNIKKGDYFVKEIRRVVEEGKKYVDGQDDSWKLENLFVTENISIESAVTNLYYIEWLLNQADVNYSIDVNSSEAQYLEIGSTIGMTMGLDLLRELCRYSGWYFWFDSNNTCHISKIKKDLDNIADTIYDTEIINFESRKDDKMLRNRGLVYGGANTNSGGYILGEETRYTGYEYDSRDIRTVVYSNSSISYQASANNLASQLVNEFARLTHVKIVTLAGLYNLKINDTIYLDSKYYNGACLIMSIESSATPSGMITVLTLDSRCPKLVTYFGHDYVYIGTDGQGVWRKSISVPAASWENYSAGISSEDLYIKDLKINNGIFACIGSNNVYVRSINTNWIKINLPSEYSDYIAKGIAIDNTSEKIYAVYLGQSDSILVTLNFSTIVEILKIVDGSLKSIYVNDVDVYSDIPVITGYTGYGIEPDEGFNMIAPISGYDSFGETLVVHWAYSVNDTIYIDFKTYNINTGNFVYGITPFIVGGGTLFPISKINSCSYIDGNFYYVALADNLNRRIIVLKYNIASNSAEIYDEISMGSLYMSGIVAHKTALTGINWVFFIKTRTLTVLDHPLSDYYYYTKYLLFFNTKIIRYCRNRPDLPPCGDFSEKKYKLLITYTIIDLINGNITDESVEVFPETDWGVPYPYFSFIKPPYLVEDIYGNNAIIIRWIRYYNYSLQQYMDKKVTLYLDSGVPVFSGDISIFNYNSIHKIVSTVSYTYRYNYATRSPVGNIDFAWYYDTYHKVFKNGFLNVYTGDFTESGYFVNGDYTEYEGKFFNYYKPDEVFTLSSGRFYPNPLNNYKIATLFKYNPLKLNDYRLSEINPVPYEFYFVTNFSLPFSSYAVDLEFDDRFFIYRVINPAGGYLFYPKKYTPFLGFSTYIRDGNVFRLIDTTPDLTVLENNLGSNIVTYPTYSGTYPISLRVSFIDQYGEFYSPSNEIITTLSSGVFNGFSDLRTYYANPDYIGYSYVTTSGDNFYISVVVSGDLKTSQIDLVDEFVTLSGFSNVTKIETSNYSDYYFFTVSGNLFYQKMYPQTSFSLAINNIPSSEITIIRLDDRL